MKISSHFSDIHGKRVHYLTCGQGEPLVLLHAYLSSAKTFVGVIEYLSEKYKVYAPDFPGFGLSDELPGRPTLEESSRIIAGWIKQERVKDFILVGVSMGGTEAVYLATELDDKIKGYVLIEPYYGPEVMLFPQSVIKSIELLSLFFNKIVPPILGNKLWSAKRPLAFLMTHLNPLLNEVEKKRPLKQKLDILSCATYKTFWQTLDQLMKLDLSNEKAVSSKPAVLLMAPKDESLDYQKTFQGFKRIFPNIREVPIDLTRHYPVEPVTARYLKTHYPNLLDTIIKVSKSSTPDYITV